MDAQAKEFRVNLWSTQSCAERCRLGADVDPGLKNECRDLRSDFVKAICADHAPLNNAHMCAPFIYIHTTLPSRPKMKTLDWINTPRRIINLKVRNCAFRGWLWKNWRRQCCLRNQITRVLWRCTFHCVCVHFVCVFVKLLFLKEKCALGNGYSLKSRALCQAGAYF